MTKKSKDFYWVTESFVDGEWRPGCKDYVGILFVSRQAARVDRKALLEIFPTDGLKLRVSKYARVS